MSSIDPINPFLDDMQLFFDGRLVSYADIGANDGSTFAAVVQSGLAINRALLVEPNPKVFERLQKNIKLHGELPNVTLEQVALSDVTDQLVLQDLNDMSSIVSEEDASSDRQFIVKGKRLDDMSDMFPDHHISILKVDVEGHELQVLKGATSLLEAGAIDVIYVEVAFGPERQGATNLRLVEDMLYPSGYEIFKIYEQVHDWIEDHPVLTRCNVAFLSEKLRCRYPISLLKKQQELRKEVLELEAAMTLQSKEHDRALNERYAEISALTDMLADRPGKPDSVHSPAVEQDTIYRRPYRTKIGPYSFRPRQIYGILITLAWFLGIAALYFFLEAQ